MNASVRLHGLMVAIAVMLFVVACCPYVAWADDLTSAQNINSFKTQAGSDFSSATAVSADRETTAVINDSGDEQWFKVVLPQAGRFQILFKGAYYVDGGNWTVSLRTSGNQEIWVRSHSASDVTAETFGCVGLPSGTYYIRVTCSWRNEGLSYAFTPQFQSSGAWETEINDDLVQADMLSLNRETSATLRESDDVDWYKVSLPAAGRFQMAFGGDYYADGGDWNVSLRDSSNTELLSRSHAASSVTAETFGVTGLPAGTYYIKVSGSWRNVDLKYHLNPQFQQITGWETEFNETITTADDVTMASTVYATSSDDGDADWFKIVFPKKGRLQITFGSEYYIDGGDWEFSIRNSINSELQSFSHPASKKTSKAYVTTNKLDPGTYYIRVTGSWRNADLIYHFTPGFYVAKTKMSKLTASKKSFKAKWKKASGASGYQLRYATKANMSKAKIVNVSKKKASKSIKKLKAKKRYYVQVRVVKKIEGKAYYSAWSKKLSVKTRK